MNIMGHGHTRIGKGSLKIFFINNLSTLVAVFTDSQRAVFPYFRITIGILSSKPLQPPYIFDYSN